MDMTDSNLQERFAGSREDFCKGLESLIISDKKRKEFHKLYSDKIVEYNYGIGITDNKMTCEINFDSAVQNGNGWKFILML